MDKPKQNSQSSICAISLHSCKHETGKNALSFKPNYKNLLPEKLDAVNSQLKNPNKTKTLQKYKCLLNATKCHMTSLSTQMTVTRDHGVDGGHCQARWKDCSQD